MKKIRYKVSKSENWTRRSMKENNEGNNTNFVPTYFAWKTMSEQKNICKRLANITNKDND